MGPNTGRDSDGSGLDQYWRRRAVALAGVLAAVGLLTWTCAGTGEEEPGRDAGAAESPAPSPPTAMPTVTVTTTASPEPSPADDGGPCDDGDLVVAMSAAEDTFPRTERPEFRVTVVNTGEGACAFDTGSLDVRITSGSDRIWSSAECRRGDAPEATLRRGIPYVDTVIWDRRRGCEDGRAARPGTYVADLKGEKAEEQVFRLR
ncbi:hypothetical protein [Actinomadura sp. GTD37]|uniref:hypothetical protein n=1 Tax=Actinomadura sp. GTD37 TaxID=1778030 RepID=UPI0035BF59A8